MTERILKFLKKNHISMEDIKYITRSEGKTCVHLINGRTVQTFITVKDFLETLAPYDYISINKGTIVSKIQIDYIEDGIYHMLDGIELVGRRRTMNAHRVLNENLHAGISSSLLPSDVRNRFAILDEMPVAFCVIELVFDKNGSGIDFIFRYCNKEMEVLEGMTIDKMLNRSFYRIFPNADKKWLAAYTDVALNGNHRHLRDYSPEIDKEIFIQCFQPLDGFCACLLTPVESLDKTTKATELTQLF